MERRLLPPFVADRGLSPWAVASLPRLEEATFTGAYPIATIRFQDSTLPVEAELEAFTPFVPLDDRISGLPVAVFLWRLRNPSSRPVELTLAYTPDESRWASTASRTCPADAGTRCSAAT